MKKIYLILAVLSVFTLSSCELKNELMDREELVEANQGIVKINLKNNAKVNVNTRAEATGGTLKPGVFAPEELNVQNYILEIKKGEQIVKMGKISDLGGNNGNLNLQLEAGAYTVTAYNYNGSADLVSERPFFMGSNSFEILPGQPTNVSVECKLQNIEVGVSLDKTFLDAFKDDYSITIDNGANGTQVMTKANISKKFYFAVPAGKKSINVSIKANTIEKDGNPSQFVQRTYSITKPGNADLAAGDAFIINLNQDGATTSHIQLGITVDFSFAEQNEVITIPSENITFNPTEQPEPQPQPGDAIKFTGLPAEYTNPHATGQSVIVDFNVPGGIKNLFVTIISDNEVFMGTLTGYGLDEQFDIANPGKLEGVLTGSLEAGEGIGLIKPGEKIAGKTAYTFDITSFMTLLNLFDDSSNTFTIKVVDNAGNEKSGDLKVTIKG